MEKRFVIKAEGTDSPGIAARITEIIFNCGCNIVTTNMKSITGEFSMIALVQLSREMEGMDVNSLRSRFDGFVEEFGVSVAVREAVVETAADREETDRRRFHVSFSGVDRPGLVYRVTHFLGSKNINILDVDLRCDEAKCHYNMNLLVESPAFLRTDELRDEMKVLEQELESRIMLEPVYSPPPLQRYF